MFPRNVYIVECPLMGKWEGQQLEKENWVQTHTPPSKL